MKLTNHLTNIIDLAKQGDPEVCNLINDMFYILDEGTLYFLNSRNFSYSYGNSGVKSELVQREIDDCIYNVNHITIKNNSQTPIVYKLDVLNIDNSFVDNMERITSFNTGLKTNSGKNILKLQVVQEEPKAYNKLFLLDLIKFEGEYYARLMKQNCLKNRNEKDFEKVVFISLNQKQLSNIISNKESNEKTK